MQVNRVKINNRKKMNKRAKRYLLITLLIVMITSFSVAVTYAQLSALDKKLISQEAEIEKLNKTKNSLEGEIKGIKGSYRIKQEAIYRLGMVYPEENQIVYVDMSKERIQKDVNNNVFLSPIISVLKSFTNN